MKIISISTERKLFDKQNKVFERIKEYSVFANENIYLVFTNDKKNLEISEKVGENIFKVVPIFGKNKLEQIYNLFKFFKTEDINKQTEQIVISSQDAFEIGFLSLFFARKNKAKLLVQIHTDISGKFFKTESLRNFFQYFLAQFVLKKADKIRVVSGKMQNYLFQNLSIEKHKVMLLPIYTDLSKFNFNLKNRKKTKILMLSRIEKVKNIPLGILVVEDLRKKTNENIVLKIVGNGSLKKKYLKDFKDKKFIEWADWTENIENEYHEADIFLISSLYEGWGMTAVESVACGTPVVMTPVGAAREFVVDEVNGFVAKNNSRKDLAQALEKSLNFDFDEKVMKKSLENLNTKKEYFTKLKDFFESPVL